MRVTENEAGVFVSTDDDEVLFGSYSKDRKRARAIALLLAKAPVILKCLEAAVENISEDPYKVVADYVKELLAVEQKET